MTDDDCETDPSGREGAIAPGGLGPAPGRADGVARPGAKDAGTCRCPVWLVVDGGRPGAEPEPTHRLWSSRGYARCLPCFLRDDPWVSLHSRFSSSEWRLDPRTSAVQRVQPVDFGGVPADLMAELKFVVVMDVALPSGRRSGIETAAAFARRLASIGRWMAHVELASVSELGDGVGELFLQSLAQAAEQLHAGTLEPDRGDWDPRTPRGDEARGFAKGGRVAFTTVEAFAKAFLVMAAISEGLEALGGFHPRGAPFEEGTAAGVAEGWPARADEAVQRLPDAVLEPLVAQARRMMGVPADDVVRLVERFARAVSRGVPAVEAAEALAGFRFRRVKGEARPWRARLVSKSLTPFGAIVHLVRLVRDAAVLLQLLGVGNRPGETLALPAGAGPRTLPHAGSDLLPRCVTEVATKSGYLVEVLLHGFVLKRSRVPRRVTWLIGARLPDGRDPYALEALVVLERLFAPLRPFAVEEGRDRLVLDFAAGVEDAIEMIPGATGRLAQSVRLSIARFADLSGVPDEEAGRDLRRYRDTNGACIALYQCRKTWAQLVYRIDPGLMLAINAQLQNGDPEETHESYVTKDPTFRRELEVGTSRLTVMLKRQVMDGGDARLPTAAGAIDAAMARAGPAMPRDVRERLWRARAERPAGIFGHGGLRPRAGVPNILADMRGPVDFGGGGSSDPAGDPHALGRDGPALLRGLVADRRRCVAELGGVGRAPGPERDRAMAAERRLRSLGFALDGEEDEAGAIGGVGGEGDREDRNG